MSNLPFLSDGFPLDRPLSEVPKTTGVYAIHCRVNDFVYFGSTVQGFRNRLSQHIGCLKRSTHHSFLLQRDVACYGFQSFSFYVVEVCLPEQCFNREQFWLDLRGVGFRNRSYNICPTAEIASGVAEVNSLEYVVISPDQQEFHIRNLTKFCRENNLIPGQMINVAKAVHDQHKGWRCRYAVESKEDHQARLNLLRRNREYVVTSPSGVEQTIKNLSRFCEENGLRDSDMISIARGKLRVSKGWKCRYANETEELREKRLSLTGKDKRYIVTFPDGHEEEIEGLPDFCKQHNLFCSTMTKVAKGKHFQHKGFKLRYANESPQDRLEKLKERKNNREYIVTDPSGNEYLTNDLKSFAKQHNVSHYSLSKMVYGETLDGTSGWKCRLAWETETERRARVTAKINIKRHRNR